MFLWGESYRIGNASVRLESKHNTYYKFFPLKKASSRVACFLLLLFTNNMWKKCFFSRVLYKMFNMNILLKNYFFNAVLFYLSNAIHKAHMTHKKSLRLCIQMIRCIGKKSPEPFFLVFLSSFLNKCPPGYFLFTALEFLYGVLNCAINIVYL